jgi:hypothetical protein
MSAPDTSDLLAEIDALRAELNEWRTGYVKLAQQANAYVFHGHALDVLAAIVEAQAAAHNRPPRDYTAGHDPEVVRAFMKRFEDTK